MSYIANIVRSPGDPKILVSGQSSLSTADHLGRALGWFSLGLGVLELVAPRRVTRALGMEGREGLVQAYGAREIGTGMVTLSTERRTGLWARVAGDALDIATLSTGLDRRNPQNKNVKWALAMVVGVTLLDVASVQAQAVRHARKNNVQRTQRNLSGFPQGVEKARGAARKREPASTA